MTEPSFCVCVREREREREEREKLIHTDTDTTISCQTLTGNFVFIFRMTIENTFSYSLSWSVWILDGLKIFPGGHCIALFSG